MINGLGKIQASVDTLFCIQLYYLVRTMQYTVFTRVNQKALQVLSLSLYILSTAAEIIDSFMGFTWILTLSYLLLKSKSKSKATWQQASITYERWVSRCFEKRKNHETMKGGKNIDKIGEQGKVNGCNLSGVKGVKGKASNSKIKGQLVFSSH